jgi:hypothetical protein
MSRYLRTFVLFLSVAIPASTAFALITGGEGNKPIRDPGWPAGAAAIFNHPSRIAHWEGPPFGGGQYFAEYRGDAKELNQLLADFAKIDAKVKRIIVHDGVGHSFWLNPNREKSKDDESQMDWMFMVWVPQNWDHLRRLPASLRSPDLSGEQAAPPTEFVIYTGGSIRWPDVVIPKGIELRDERLEAHGFKFADGTVLEGTITSVATKQPLAGRMELQRIEPQKTGGYKYPTAATVTADAKGHWVLKNAPQGWYRIVLLHEGYVPRVVGYGKYDAQPGWHLFDGALSRPANISGTVVDESGKPVAGANVDVRDLATQDQSYESTSDFKSKTDANGRFQIEAICDATARVSAGKPGFVLPGLGEKIKTPAKGVTLKIKSSGQVHVTVDFGTLKRPSGYIVELEPEGGNKVGSWGGSGNIDKDNKISFNDVPPGRYFLKGRPNPGSEKETTTPIAIDLKGGATENVKITAIVLPR